MKQKIKIINNKIMNFPDEKRKELVEKAIKANVKFFKLKCSFNIVFLEKREELDKIHGSPTEEWGIGGVYEDNTVYIFDIDVFDKVSNHSSEEFFPTLVHEISHIYINNNFKFSFPIWLHEGIAYVVAGQDKTTKDIDLDIKNSHTLEEWERNYPYGTSGRFTRFIIDKYSKNRLLELLKMLKKDETKEGFNNKFFKVFKNSFYDSLVDFYKVIGFVDEKREIKKE